MFKIETPIEGKSRTSATKKNKKSDKEVDESTKPQKKKFSKTPF